ncbi:ABC transporter permease [Neorhizobium sp. T786]|uniref:ABC transporter permease n=1 Tax=Pseudorhizobium xiangyangii TaxID=2883104 RepID=UPI001CFF7606|nr:ABC transporter permease [Neorhizobium xiangyangii]MCB5201596.1 ABC transporter permease [Neorhizobium xiangyangii]
MAAISLFVGVSEVSLLAIVSGQADEKMLMVLAASRLPRTLALILAGAGMAVAGTIMQMLSRNRFVEPSTAGTVESASLGMLAVLLLAPGLPVMLKMLVASAFALAGTGLFLAILRKVPLRSPVLVPLIGLMLGGVINACTTFFAYRYDLMQAMGAWTSGDFSTVLRGRYEVLWVACALTVAAYIAADRFTVAGMGEDFSTNLGLNYGRVVALGLVIVSMVTASVVVTAGILPFIGLIVPNLVSMIMGDRLRHTLPWIALTGAALVLVCDIVGRVVNAPYEIPVGSVLGIVGSIFFLNMLLRRRFRAA